MKPHNLGFVFLKPFESGSTANDGGKQIKSPFAGVRIGVKVMAEHGSHINNLTNLCMLNLLVCPLFISLAF